MQTTIVIENKLKHNIIESERTYVSVDNVVQHKYVCTIYNIVST